MKENKSMQLKHSIQKKLMAATSMLMVAVIMMVSSTYAWFTLSTAPEVTGITTAVGANGNLEIALANADTWANPELVGSGVNTSGDYYTWGNLVDVSDESYGLDAIKLMPARLNVTNNTVGDSFLETPSYGVDGRVSELTPNTVTGTYIPATSGNAAQFTANDGIGVRAIGTASAMTDRQLAYRNAKSALQIGSTTTKSKASASLANNGDALADIVIQRAVNDADSFTETQVTTIGNVLTDLGEAMDTAKAAIEGAIEGLAASKRAQDAGIDDTEYSSIAENVNVDTITVNTDNTISVLGQTITLTTNLVNAITTYQEALEDYDAAEAAYEGITYTGTTTVDNGDGTTTTLQTTTWAQLNGVLQYIVNVEGESVTINDKTPSEFTSDLGGQVSEVLSKGINVQLNEGSGIYYNLAELAGNFKTEVTLHNISAMGVTVAELPANMVTNVPATQQAYFTGCISDIVKAGAPASGSNTEANAKITDVYGYAIDMLFRTNAANSNLLLRTTPTDRIYEENTNSESDTMGGGSTMTFELTDTTFPLESMVNLMKAIRIVFMDGSQSILAQARLDMEQTAPTTGSVETALTADDITSGGLVAGTTKTMATDGSVTTTVITINYDTDGTTVTGGTKTVTTTTPNYTVLGGGTEITANMLVYSETTTPVTSQPVETALTTEEITAANAGTLTAGTTEVENTDGSVTKTVIAFTYGDATNTALVTAGTKTVTTTSYVTTGTYSEADTGVITALDQNTPQKVTVLVYLDGDYVDNSMVANAATTMSGSMNLQFASDADLVPMHYTSLYEAGQAVGGTATPAPTAVPTAAPTPAP